MAAVIDRLFSLFDGSEPAAPVVHNPAMGMRGPVGSPSGPAVSPADGSKPWAFKDTPAGRTVTGIGDYLSDNANAVAQGSRFQAMAERGAAPLMGAPEAGPEAAQAAPLTADSPLTQLPGTQVEDANLQKPDPAVAKRLLEQIDAAMAKAQSGQTPPLPVRRPTAEVSPVPLSPAQAAAKQGMTAPGSAKPQESEGTTAKDVQDFFADVSAAGSGNVNSKVGAFMTGSHRAIQSGINRKDKETAIATASEQKTYDRGRDAKKDALAATKEARDAKKDAVELRKMEAEIKKLVDPSLDIKDKIALENQVSYLMNSMLKDGQDYDDVLKKGRELLQEKQSRVMGKTALASDTGAGGNTPGGDGASEASPALPTSQESFDKLPSGAWFKNPADGRIMQKK
jgi:hypothetical protein